MEGACTKSFKKPFTVVEEGALQRGCFPSFPLHTLKLTLHICTDSIDITDSTAQNTDILCMYIHDSGWKFLWSDCSQFHGFLVGRSCLSARFQCRAPTTSTCDSSENPAAVTVQVRNYPRAATWCPSSFFALCGSLAGDLARVAVSVSVSVFLIRICVLLLRSREFLKIVRSACHYEFSMNSSALHSAFNGWISCAFGFKSYWSLSVLIWSLLFFLSMFFWQNISYESVHRFTSQIVISATLHHPPSTSFIPCVLAHIFSRFSFCNFVVLVHSLSSILPCRWALNCTCSSFSSVPFSSNHNSVTIRIFSTSLPYPRWIEVCIVWTSCLRLFLHFLPFHQLWLTFINYDSFSSGWAFACCISYFWSTWKPQRLLRSREGTYGPGPAWTKSGSCYW